jgi:hypothetical protein
VEDLAYTLADAIAKLNDTLTRIADALDNDVEDDIRGTLHRIAEALEKKDAE